MGLKSIWLVSLFKKKRLRDSHTQGKHHMNTQAEVGLKLLQSKGCPRPLAKHQEPGEKLKALRGQTLPPFDHELLLFRPL